MNCLNIKSLKYAGFAIIFSVVAWLPASAQFTIERPTASSQVGTLVRPLDTLNRDAQIYEDYFNRAKWRAERKALIRERNTIELGGSLNASTTQYNDAWTSSGDNTIAAMLKLYLYHTYQKERFTLNSKLDAKYGLNSITKVWFKNEDEFVISTQASWKMVKSWSYGANAKFRSQFVTGYKSRTDKTKISNFMAPGYLDISFSLNYNSPNAKWPFKVALSPVAMSGTFVSDDDLAQQGRYGMKVETDASGNILSWRNSRFEGGSSVQVDYDRTFGEKKLLRYRSTLFSFYGWFTNLAGDREAGEKALVPTMRWENTIDIKATKYLTTSIYWQLFYDRSQVDKMQIKSLITVGVGYTFKNK